MKKGASYHSEDAVKVKVYDLNVISRILQYLGPYRILVYFTIIAVIISALLEFARPIIIMYIVDDGILVSNYDMIKVFSLWLLIIEVAKYVINYLQGFMLQYLGQNMIRDIRQETFYQLNKLTLRYHDKNPVGRLVTRVLNDVQGMGELFSMGLAVLVKDVFLIAGIVVAMLLLNVKLTLYSLVVLPIILIVTLYFKNAIRRYHRTIRLVLARLNAFMAESISGIKIIKVFNKQSKNMTTFEDINLEHMDLNIKALKYQSFFIPIISFLGSIEIAILLYYGGNLQSVEGVSLGILIAFIQLVQMLFQPIQDITDKYTLFQSSMASAERLFTIIDEKPEIINSPKKIQVPEKLKGEIEFKNVWFAYNNEDWVLKNISFKINPGEKVALVGPTGEGKTTITSLLARYYDVNKGEILLDGVNIKEYDIYQLRRNLGIVMQDVFLFSGTIRENIALAFESDKNKVEEVSKIVNAYNFIVEKSDGFDTKVFERGSTLSAGQKQLVSFARALYFGPDVIILDEATSAVDMETEKVIIDSIQKLTKGRTSIIVAHRLQTIRNCDRIFVINKGQIVQEGTHDELLRQPGLYCKLHRIQFENY